METRTDSSAATEGEVISFIDVWVSCTFTGREIVVDVARGVILQRALASDKEQTKKLTEMRERDDGEKLRDGK